MPTIDVEGRLLKVLKEIEVQYQKDHLGTDPVEFPRRYRRPHDQEAVAFLAAGLAYGAVPQIRRSLENLLGRLGSRPAAVLASRSRGELRKRFRGFVHRWSRGPDVADLGHLLGRIQKKWGGLESFFLEGDAGGEDMAEAASSFGRRALALNPGGTRRGLRWFFPDPALGSASKRLFLFLRWMVRPQDGVDLGLWKRLSPARLLIPLDTHLQRIGWGLRFTERKTADLKAAREITAALRKLDPADPTRFDFSLCRLGILSRCSGRAGLPFRKTCPLYGICRHK